MSSDDVAWNSGGKGPTCNVCHSNEQVFWAVHKVRPSLRGSAHWIKLPYKNTYKGWWCHNHNPAEFVSDKPTYS